MTDLVTFGETSLRLSPVGNERLETAAEVRMRVSGTESNVAVTASQLGADAMWLSKLPDTPLGHRVDRAVREHGVETEIAWADADDGRQGLLFAEEGPRPRERRFIQDRTDAAISTVTPGELPMNRVQEADVTFVSGSTLSLSGSVVETAEAVMRAAGAGLVAMDLDYRPGLWSPGAARETLDGVLDAVDVLVANEDQARTVFDRTGEPRELAHRIASAQEFDLVVVTRSERGALAWHDNVIHEQEGVEVEAVDPSGQHEAFTGAFLDRLLDGAGADDALKHGVAAATLTRTLPGSMSTVTPDEVDAVVDEFGSGR